MDRQWQEIIRKANQRKAVVDQRLDMWRTFQLLKDELQEKMAEFRASFGINSSDALLTVSQMQLKHTYCLVSV